jgi:transcriptional regulator with XRE-family HTH domain
MNDRELTLRAGEKLRRIRMRLGLSLREVERRSLKLVAERQNRDYSLSRTWVTDIEKGRFVPGTFKVASLSVIYQLTIAEIHAIYGIDPGDIVKDRMVFRPPKTHLVTFADGAAPGSETATVKSEAAVPFESTNLLSRLVDIWGEVPVPLLRHLDLRRCLYGYIGMQDRTMSPLLPPGTFVQIDAKQIRVQKTAGTKEAGQSQFTRPIYFLDIRTGYACGWCEVKDGMLTLIPHPDSGEQTRVFRYPSEVDVVGRVTGVAMRIAKESFAPLGKASHREEPEK